MYDAIVIGARVAGAPTAMLLARSGYRVLLLDRASFPSDTLSTHQVQLPGCVQLKRWGLFDTVLATHPGIVRTVHFDAGATTLTGSYPMVDGVDFMVSPRRTRLDALLVAAAREAGAEVREEFGVQKLLWDDGRVVGVRGATKQGITVDEHARIVIGADGRHSLVAKSVAAPRYDEHPVLTCGYYTYFEGLPTSGGEMYARDRCMIGVWPTNENLTLIYVSEPITEFATFRTDVEAHYFAALERVPALAERVRQSRRVERILGTGEVANGYRRPYGPGWALVGDAGYVRDPITGYGISDAFRDAQLLADAIHAGLGGQQPMEAALASYERQRNQAAQPLYAFTLETARMRPFSPVQLALLRALEHNTAAATEFIGVLTGAIRSTDFFTPRKLLRILGVREMGRLAIQSIRRPQPRLVEV